MVKSKLVITIERQYGSGGRIVGKKLAEELACRGIVISRRTVAKYREELQIPDCRGRKEY